jgi:hypothetical protein
MTTDIFGPDGRLTNSEDISRPASATADAKGVHPCAVIPLKIIAEFGGAGLSAHAPALPPKLYQHVIAELTSAAVGMAHDKNVSVSPEDCASVAHIAVEKFNAATIDGISRCEPGAIALVVATINRILDVFAAAQVIQLLRSMEGYDQLDPRMIITEAEAWMCEITIANFAGDMRYRWPAPLEMVRSYYRAGTSGPVSARYPEGRSMRAAYFLDPGACRRAAKGARPALSPVGPIHPVAGAAKAPRKKHVRAELTLPSLTPLLIRCPALDSKSRLVVPEGRLVKTLPGGAVVTSWWKNGLLHRDPKDGPAWHRKDTNGERSEYALHGRLHRDQKDGPAFIDTNFEGRGFLHEEYFEYGVSHRPSAEGPAVISTDSTGRRILEAYIRYGQFHRDPAQGPAVAQFIPEDQTQLTEYYINGRLHRDENEGPAIVNQHVDTGVIYYEAYHRDGEMHREHGPCSTARYANGSLCSQSWNRRGKPHRDPAEGPAYSFWNEDGTIVDEDFWQDGELVHWADSDTAEVTS